MKQRCNKGIRRSCVLIPAKAGGATHKTVGTGPVILKRRSQLKVGRVPNPPTLLKLGIFPSSSAMNDYRAIYRALGQIGVIFVMFEIRGGLKFQVDRWFEKLRRRQDDSWENQKPHLNQRAGFMVRLYSSTNSETSPPTPFCARFPRTLWSDELVNNRVLLLH